MSDADDLEDIREQKRRELLEQAKQQQENTSPQPGGNDEDQVDALLKQYLTDDARKRLNTVKMAHPERAQAIKQQLVALIRQGRLNERLGEEKMKEILKEADDSDSTSFDIKRR